MEKIKNSFKASFRKGIIFGLLDIVLRLGALFLWLATVKLLFSFVYEALFLEPVFSETIWWCVYSLLMFVTVTALAYEAVWDRE
ncbi:MAG: hypothetical protein ACI352_02300 [Elusimicrobiaceae bacterium]|nr:hypothetical protein [Elusimicrobiota bacterium]